MRTGIRSLLNTNLMAMLEFKKKILTKVSFDIELFEKELKKAIKWVMPDELPKLKQWCYNYFDKKYVPIMDRCFAEAQIIE